MMAGHKGYENQHHLIVVRGSESTEDADDRSFKAVQEGREEDVCSLIKQKADVTKRSRRIKQY